MAEAVHLHYRRTAQYTNTTQAWETTDTITAASLTTAGFAANDEVVIIYYANLESANGANHPRFRVRYNGTTIAPTTGSNEAQYDTGTTGVERSHMWMERVDLGATVQAFDFGLDLASGSADCYLNKLEVLILRLSDLGTENTDWFWNQSDETTPTDFPTTWGSKASVTWTPGSVTDWAVIGSAHANNDSSANSHQCRITLDGSEIAGGFQEEGESSNEHKRWVIFDVIPSLSAASHTVAWQNQAESTGTMTHSRSSLLIFKPSTFADFYIHEAGTVSCANSTDVQVATITDTLSTTQNVFMVGNGNANLDSLNADGWMWIRQDGTTVVDPVMNQGAGRTTLRTYDATDESQAQVLAYKNLTGALDLDLFFHHNGGGARDLLNTKFLVWGMELAAGGDATVNAATVAAVAAQPAASASGAATVTAATVAAVAGQPAATAAGGATVTAVTVGAAAAVGAVSPTGDAAVAPATVAAVADQPAATAGVSVTVTPSTVAAVADQPAASATGGATVTATTVAAAADQPAATASGGATVTAATVAATATQPAATATGGATVTAVTAAASASVGTPSATGDATVTAATVGAVAAQPAAAAGGGATHTATTVAAAAAQPAVTATGGATVTATTVAAVADQPAATASGGDSETEVTPATVAAAAAVGTVTATGGATVTASTVAAVAAVPTATPDVTYRYTEHAVTSSTIGAAMTINTTAASATAATVEAAAA